MLEEYKGTIAEIIFHNNENGYTVAVFEDGTGSVYRCGDFAGGQRGKTLPAEG